MTFECLIEMSFFGCNPWVRESEILPPFLHLFEEQQFGQQL